MKNLKEKLLAMPAAIWHKISRWFLAMSFTKKVGLILAFVGLFYLIKSIVKSFRGNTDTTSSSRAFAPIVHPQQIMRNDSLGLGHYGAPRGNRQHNGIDIEVYKGQTIHAPFAGKLTRTYQVYTDDSKYRGLEIVSDAGFKVKIMYCLPYDNLVGYHVSQGQAIGYTQSISEKYGSAMQDHIHVELYQLGVRIDPTKHIILN